MSKEHKCPYCGGGGTKKSARMASLQTHYTFGYGERKWVCSKCASEWTSCYAIPPKGHSPDMPKKSERIVEPGFVDGVRGYTHPVVLKISIKAPSGQDEICENTPVVASENNNPPAEQGS